MDRQTRRASGFRIWEHLSDAEFAIARAIDSLKLALAIRRWWKSADEWRKWTVSTMLAWLFSGTPTLAFGLAVGFLLVWMRIPMYDSFGSITGKYLMAFFGSVVFLYFSGPRAYRVIERHFDLEVPIFVCTTKGCGGNLSYHDTVKIGRLCSYCRGPVRLLSAQEKRRQFRSHRGWF